MKSGSHDFKPLSLLLVLAVLTGIEIPAYASEISVDAAVDRNVITVGDVINLSIQVRYDSDITPRMPGADTPLGEFEIRDHRIEAPLSTPDGRLLARSYFSLTVFSPGVIQIPSVEISYVSIDGKTQGSAATDPIEVKVVRTLAEESEDIEDIKPPLEVPRDWLPMLLAFLGGVILAAVAVFLYRSRRRRAALVDRGPAFPNRPPHEVAYEALERLKRSDLLIKGEIPRFHILLSEIIRRYIEGRYRVDALEMATGEVLDGLRRSKVEKEIINLIERFLDQCDLVKFAKLRPSETKSLEVFDLGREVVDRTCLVPEVSAPTQNKALDEASPSGPEQAATKVSQREEG